LTAPPRAASLRAAMTLLALDVSNTSIKAGVFRGETLLADWRFSTDRSRLADEYGMLLLSLFGAAGLSAGDVAGVSISCVVPPLKSVFEQVARRYLEVDPLVVGPDVKTGLRLAVDNPREVGADRVVNAVATHRLHGGPAIAIAFGTATVFDCVSAAGEYLGGAIAPGAVVALESLARSAAQLYQVELVRPPQCIGRNTVHMMQSGLVLGYAGLVEGLVGRLKRELAGDAPVKVIATGGLAEVVAPETAAIDCVDPQLTLNGLRLIHELNRGA
jgi:type III pantothenate kinase